MKRSIVTATFSGLLILATGATALAGDVCLNLGGVHYIGKAVKIPSKGKCSTWKGFVPAGSLCLTTGLTTGTLCTSTDDTHTDGTLITTCLTAATPNLVVFTDHLTLPRPALVGGTERFSTLDAGMATGTNTTFSANVEDCTTALGAKAPPIP